MEDDLDSGDCEDTAVPVARRKDHETYDEESSDEEDDNVLGLNSLKTLKNVNPFAMAANLFSEEDEGVEEDTRNQIAMVSED